MLSNLGGRARRVQSFVVETKRSLPSRARRRCTSAPAGDVGRSERAMTSPSHALRTRRGASSRMPRPERDVDLPGGDHDSVKGVTLTSCKEMCIGDAACRAFSYVQNSMVLVE